MGSNIGYHTRLWSDNTVKATGGSFGGSIDMETVNRLMRLFEVVVKPSGTPVFVDRQGREVTLYLTVDAASTEKGKVAMAAWRKEREAQVRREEEQAEERASEVAQAMEGLSHDKIMARLRTPAKAAAGAA